MMSLICALGAWLFIALLMIQAIESLRQGQRYLRQLHNIPCSQCGFYTHCPALKCTVHPHQALTVEATSCQDFEPIYGALQ